MSNQIQIGIFGQEVTLKYGLRSSKRLRELFPDLEKLNTLAPEDLLILAVKSALPVDFQSKSDDEITDELDNVDPLLLNKAFEAFKSNIGFFVKALTGGDAQVDPDSQNKKTGKGK